MICKKFDIINKLNKYNKISTMRGGERNGI